MQNNTQDFDYEALKNKTLEQFRSGKDLFSKGGAFAPLLKEFLEAALQAELEAHLQNEDPQLQNRKNGYNTKQLKTAHGTIELDTPRDRNSDFVPDIVKKRETILGRSLESRILAMYGHGMSFRAISSHIKEMYDTDISASTLSSITDSIIPLVKQWQSRTLDRVYCMVWLDAMFYKVKDEGRITNRCVYNILGVTVEGKKEVLGMYISESEGANFWLSVLTDLQNRGVEDLLIASIDNLKGFAEAIATVFPRTEIQSCIVHQIRNSLKYVTTKDKREFMGDLKPIYRAVSKEIAELHLENLEKKWGKKYAVVIGSWQRNWNKLSTYFNYPAEIRKMIYTTNTIEGFHRQIRKVTKTKGAFTSDMALLKLMYLASKNIQKKWVKAISNWGIMIAQLSIIYPDRVKLTI